VEEVKWKVDVVLGVVLVQEADIETNIFEVFYTKHKALSGRLYWCTAKVF